MDLIDDERLRQWCQPTDDGSGTIIVHPAMLDVARRLRLGKRGAFNVAAFR